METMAVVAFGLLSSFACITDVDNTPPQVEAIPPVELVSINHVHEQSFFTGDWHYVEGEKGDRQ